RDSISRRREDDSGFLRERGALRCPALPARAGAAHLALAPGRLRRAGRPAHHPRLSPRCGAALLDDLAGGKICAGDFLECRGRAPFPLAPRHRWGFRRGRIRAREPAALGNVALQQPHLHFPAPGRVAAVYDRRIILVVERLRRLEVSSERHPIYFVTACTERRVSILAQDPVHESLITFGKAGESHGAWLGAYVLMLDHLHLFFVFDEERMGLSAWM